MTSVCLAILVALELDSMMGRLLPVKADQVIIFQIDHLMMMIPPIGKVVRMMKTICGLE